MGIRKRIRFTKITREEDRRQKGGRLMSSGRSAGYHRPASVRPPCLTEKKTEGWHASCRPGDQTDTPRQKTEGWTLHVIRAISRIPQTVERASTILDFCLLSPPSSFACDPTLTEQ